MITNTVKALTGVALSFGIQEVVGNAVKAVTPQNISKVKKVYTAIGGFAISLAIMDVAGEAVDNTIDGAASMISMIANRKKSKEESKKDWEKYYKGEEYYKGE